MSGSAVANSAVRSGANRIRQHARCARFHALQAARVRRARTRNDSSRFHRGGTQRSPYRQGQPRQQQQRAASQKKPDHRPRTRYRQQA